jgi:putative flippase GtrA
VKSHLSAFVTVGALGFVVQVAALALLTRIESVPYELATLVAVELSVVHNFWWHERWTWRDRTTARPGVLRRLSRFQASAGFTSLPGNLVLTVFFVELLGIDALIANVFAVGLLGAANFVVLDRWVFGLKGLGMAALVFGSAASAEGLEPSAEALAAWDRYHSAAQARLLAASPNGVAERVPEGGAIEVPGALIHRWRGSLLVRGVTVDELLSRLMNPGTPPPQEDVLESRVLSRTDRSLRVYLKLTRRTIISVTYDTEHEVTFCRRSARLATSESEATRIAETGSRDRGFLWRLNSYWQYTQTADGVVVDLESLSLSRPMPGIVRPVAAPIVNRIARESMWRTLEALRRYVEASPTARTSIPEASRAPRSVAANATAPGVSPCKQMVSASSGTTVPSTATTDRRSTI